MLSIATWNVNSIKARMTNVLDWLGSSGHDVILLQETKCTDDSFPRLELESAGWNLAFHGQKSYNGVAILSRFALHDVHCGLPGDGDDPQARYIEATLPQGVRVVSIYLPNGNPAPGEKFDYKLAWMRRLVAHVRTHLPNERPVVFGGDYNICPTDIDVYDPDNWKLDALCRPESRGLFRTLLHLGLTDAFRAIHPDEAHRFSFWDYQAGAWQRDMGLRIDHLLLTPQAADRLVDCDIDKGPRGREKASDHTPVWCRLDI